MIVMSICKYTIISCKDFVPLHDTNCCLHFYSKARYVLNQSYLTCISILALSSKVYQIRNNKHYYILTP